jgi:hypothetical protein
VDLVDLPESRTLGDALADYGYGHRPSNIDGKREVYRLSDGEVAGAFDAFEAWDFLTRVHQKQ